ncbi:MAG: peptide ABC transporter substrate-binding protein [Planctomycetota bacterium]
MIRSRWSALALAALALSLVGCPAGGETSTGNVGTDPTPADDDASAVDDAPTPDAPEDAAKPAQVFTFNNGAEPETLDPHLATGVPEGRLLDALFEGLVTLHPETLEPVPGVAESWEVSEDGTVYTFTLRKDAKWSNGEVVTAKDFFRSWKRGLTPATASQYAYMFFAIKNAEAFNKGEVTEFGEVGIKVQDEFTFQVTLTNPCAYFLSQAAFRTLCPVPVDLIEAKGDAWSRQGNIVGNGAFKLQEWRPNDKIVLVPNEHYWAKDEVELERLVALPIEDMETAYKLYLQGKLDWMTAVPAAKVEEIKRHPDYYASPYLGSYFYRFNTTKPPFDDVRVRKAFSLALNRSSITQDILKGGQIPATWFTPELPSYAPPKGLAEDREEAKRLLAEAGYPGGEGFPEVSVLYNTNEAHKQVAEVAVQQWKENLGVTVKLRNTEWKVYLSQVDQKDFQIARAGWIGDYVDPNTFLDCFVTDGGNNNTGWSNAEYDALIRAAAAESDPQKRAEHFLAAEKILVEDELPILPIYIYVNQGMLRDTVLGWEENVLDSHPFRYISIDQE